MATVHREGYPYLSAYYKSMSNDDIYHALKEDILTLKLKPGQMLSENEISRAYNVSRTPVKTAFLRLKGEKYIEIVPQKGSYVTLLDIQYIQDIIYMRSVLENDILHTILELDDIAGLLEQLGENLAEQRKQMERGDRNPRDFYQVDSRFHYLLFAYVNRSKMWDVIQDCQVYYTRFRLLDTLATARYGELYREHQAIVEVLKRRDREAVKPLVFDHLHGNLRSLGDRINGEFRDFFVQQ